MSESLKSLDLFFAGPRRGPWAIVLSPGQAIRLGPWNRLVDEDERPEESRMPGEAAVAGDARDEILRRHRDTRWN